MSAPTLKELVIRYFKEKGYTIIEENSRLEGNDGITRSFDLIVSKGDRKQPVWIKPWNRTVGVNVVINMDKASNAVGLIHPIIVAEKFSAHAKAYANRKAITLLTKRGIQRAIRYRR
jgi:hypothetical protein